MEADEDQGEPPAKGGALEPEWVPENEFTPFFRGSARVLGVIVAAFSLAMVIGESRSFPPPIKPMAVFGGYALGTVLAFKWERAGVALSAVSAAGLFLAIWFSKVGGPSHNPPEIVALLVLIFGLAYFLPVLLYAICWWLEDRDRKRWRARS